MERTLRQLIMSKEDNRREEAYRDSYERIHRFFLDNEIYGRGNVYRPEKAISYRAINRMISRNDTVLEVGCGNGWLSIFLANAGKKITAIDISDTAIAVANLQAHSLSTKTRSENLRFVRMSGIRMRFPSNTFDIVVSEQFIEHLHPDDFIAHLEEVYRVLKRRGGYIVFAPNGYFQRDKGLHLKLYSYNELERIFSRLGFVTKATILPVRLLSRTLLVPIATKARMEKMFRGFPRFIRHIAGLDHICVIAFKM